VIDPVDTMVGNTGSVVVPDVTVCTGNMAGNLASVVSASSVQVTQDPSGRRTDFQCGGMPALRNDGGAAFLMTVQP
jgi:hypothetical protein